MSISDRETCITRIHGDDHVGIYTGEPKYINQILKLKKEYPEDVIITHKNEDGSLCVNVPYNWLRIPKPPRKVNMTEEQKERFRERMISSRKQA